MEHKESEASVGSSGGRHEKLPLSTKLAFAFGASPNGLASTVIGFYFSAFLLEVAGVRPAVVSAILLVGRVWDAFMDPSVGFLTSRTQTRWGQLRPWIGAAALPLAVAYFALWLVPPGDTVAKLAYYLVVFLLYQTLYSCYHMPYLAMTMHLSHNPLERDSATSIRLVVEVVCVLCSNIFQGYIITGVSDDEEDFVCRNCSIEDDGTPNSSLTQAYGLAAICIGVVIAISALTMFFFVKELPETSKKPKLSFFGGLKLVMTNRNYIMLIMLVMWSWMGVQINQTNFILWLKYAVKESQYLQLLLVTLLVSTLVMLVAWYYIVLAIGKRRSLILAYFLTIPGSLFMYLVPEHAPEWLLHLSQLWGALCLSCTYLLPSIMLPNVIDHDELVNGVRREALFYSFFVFFQKFATGIAVGMSTLSLEAAGYITNPCCGETQPDSVGNTLRVVMGLVPLGLNFISFIFILLYGVTPEMERTVKQQLAERRAADVTGANESTPLTGGSDSEPVLHLADKTPLLADSYA